MSVVYKAFMNQRNSDGTFKREIAKELQPHENPYLAVALHRLNNTDTNIRYSLGHIKGGR